MSETEIPDELRYSEEDEWGRRQDDRIVIGITDYAQLQLGDVVYVELPAVGGAITKGDAFGVIESVKAVSDLYAPVSGEVLEINEALADRPELVNESCYGDGWILAIRVDSSEEFEALLDADAYRKYVEARSD